MEKGIDPNVYSKPGAEFHLQTSVQHQDGQPWWLFPTSDGEVQMSGETHNNYGFMPFAFDKTVTQEYGKNEPTNIAPNDRQPFIGYNIFSSMGVGFAASGSSTKDQEGFMPFVTSDTDYSNKGLLEDRYHHPIYNIIPKNSVTEGNPSGGYPRLNNVNGTKVFEPINLQNPDLPLIAYYQFSGYHPKQPRGAPGTNVSMLGTTYGDGGTVGTLGFLFLGVTKITTDPGKGPPIAQAIVYQPRDQYNTYSGTFDLWGVSQACTYHNEGANWYAAKSLVNLYVAGIDNNNYSPASDLRDYNSNGGPSFSKQALSDPLQIPPDVACTDKQSTEEKGPLCDSKPDGYNNEYSLKGAINIQQPKGNIYDGYLNGANHTVYIISGYGHDTDLAEGYGCNPTNWPSSNNMLLYISGIDTYGNYFYQAYEPLVAPEDVHNEPKLPPYNNQ